MIPPFENNNAPMWTRLQRSLMAAVKAEAERRSDRQQAIKEAQAAADAVRLTIRREMKKTEPWVFPKPPSANHEPRCPHCGQWLSTRYSASQPHRCVTVGIGDAARPPLESPALTGRLVPPAPPADPDHARAAGWPAHAVKQAGRYPWPENQPSAPAPALWPWALAWLAGAVSGALVAALVASLLWPG